MEPIDAVRFFSAISVHGHGLNLLEQPRRTGAERSEKSSVLSGTNSRDKKGLNESRPTARVCTPTSSPFFTFFALFPSPFLRLPPLLLLLLLLLPSFGLLRLRFPSGEPPVAISRR